MEYYFHSLSTVVVESTVTFCSPFVERFNCIL